jgi:hypothetical protein
MSPKRPLSGKKSERPRGFPVTLFRLRVLVVLMASLTGLSQSSAPASAQQFEPFASLDAELYFRRDYLIKPGPKAMAVGPIGSFSARWDYPSTKSATTAALSECRQCFTPSQVSEAHRQV